MKVVWSPKPERAHACPILAGGTGARQPGGGAAAPDSACYDGRAVSRLGLVSAGIRDPLLTLAMARLHVNVMSQALTTELTQRLEQRAPQITDPPPHS